MHILHQLGHSRTSLSLRDSIGCSVWMTREPCVGFNLASSLSLSLPLYLPSLLSHPLPTSLHSHFPTFPSSLSHLLTKLTSKPDIAIAIISLEEGLLRGTFTERDNLFSHWRGRSVHLLSRRKRDLIRRGRACQVIQSMYVCLYILAVGRRACNSPVPNHCRMAEIVSIICAKAFIIIVRKDVGLGRIARAL